MGAAAAADCRAPAVDEDDVGRRLGGGESINRWPPGVRFHPTDEELVLFYLKRKICRRRIKPSMIGDIDVYKWEPSELPEKSVLRRGDKQWFFFSPRDRKYPNGSRSNRATKHGYWKATGKDRTICHSSKAAGNKKTLVYYRGRAPKGERTDWVMHEYTLDEQLLLSLNNAQDSYALYKLFMKSGPGPKNGEQYGAPFREEEWNDAAADEGFMDQNDGEDTSAINPSGNSVPGAFEGEEDCNTLPVDDLDDLLLQLSHEQDINQGHPEFSAYTSDISKVDLEPEFGSHIMNPSHIDADCNIHGIWCEMSSMETTFQNMQSVVTHLQPIDLPDIASNQHIVAADEEFLELKDLNDPETSCFLNDISSRNPIFDTEDQFYDPYDEFDDANMYLSGSIGLPIHDVRQPHLHMDGFSDEDPQNHASLLSSELWTHGDTYNLPAVANTNLVVMAPPPASGFDYTNNSPSTAKSPAEEQSSHYAESFSQSWISSALSAFIDSVPSSPALASESALISRAIERVSSFRAVPANAPEGGAASGVQSGSGGRQPAFNRGFLFISVLVGIGAVFWVLTIGAAFKVLGGLWGRFMSS